MLCRRWVSPLNRQCLILTFKVSPFPLRHFCFPLSAEFWRFSVLILLEWESNPQPVAYTDTRCAPTLRLLLNFTLRNLFIYYLIFYLTCRGSLPWQGLKAITKKQKYERISEKKMSTPVEVLCKVSIVLRLICFSFIVEKKKIPSTINKLIW